MYATYTISPKRKLSVFMQPDFLKNDDHRSHAEVSVLDNDGHTIQSAHAPLHKDEKGVYISYKNKKIHLNDFDYLPYEELLKKKDFTENDFLATLLHSPSPFSFLVPVYPLGSLTPTPILMVPTELHFPRHEWLFKVTLEAEDESLRGTVSPIDIWTSNLYSFLKDGRYQMVDKEEYKKNNKS